MRDPAFRQLKLFLALVLALVAPHPAAAMLLVKGDPTQPPTEIAAKLNSLIDRFKAERARYTCYAVYGEQDAANCLLVLRCSMGVIGIQKNGVHAIGINFGGPHFLRDIGDDQCVTRYFFSQIQSLLEVLGALHTNRARDIIDVMDRNPRQYGRCGPALTDLGEFAEGRGGMSYGVEGKRYGPEPSTDGSEIIKIFCWYAKQR